MPFLLLFIPLAVVPVMLLYLLSKEILAPLVSINARNIKFLKYSIRAHERLKEKALARRRRRKPRTSIQSEARGEDVDPLPPLRLESATFLVRVADVDAQRIAFERDSLFYEYRLRGQIAHGVADRVVLASINKGAMIRIRLISNGKLSSDQRDLEIEGDGVILGGLNASGRATLRSGFNARAFDW